MSQNIYLMLTVVCTCLGIIFVDLKEIILVFRLSSNMHTWPVEVVSYALQVVMKSDHNMNCV